MPDPNETIAQAIPMALNPGPPKADHQRAAGQDKIGMLEAQVQIAKQEAAAAAPAQFPVRTRIAEAIRQHWIKNFKQDWQQPLCYAIAYSVARDLSEPPRAALDAAGITDAQWAAFIAAVVEGK